MKSVLRLSFVLLIATALFSCKKTVYVTPSPVNPLEGTWALTSAEESGAYGWHGFSTGLESGTFNFYGNGAATYSDGYYYMQGSWTMYAVNSGYYDEYNNYHTGTHNAIVFHLSDNTKGSTVDLYFDYVQFYNGEFVATFDNGVSTERYWFGRY
ncbi:MAG TPA: hypothetical protein PL045_09565 [Chitinophagaceae bacterium]|nr:hypothetical protein [Chitinophagaceae bacterium]